MTNALAIRDTVAKRDEQRTIAAGDGVNASGDGAESTSAASAAAKSQEAPASAITMETISARRRIEVPDDDSSFLLRAQVRYIPRERGRAFFGLKVETAILGGGLI